MRPIIGDSIAIPHIVRIIEAVIIIVDCILRHLPVFATCVAVEEEESLGTGRSVDIPGS